MAENTDLANECIQQARQARRKALQAIDDDSGAAIVADNALGLAFSGGGIRSATISLGVAQVLARHKRLLDFDYLSTVSGGGYIGSFLISLFTPDDRRGTRDPEATSIWSSLIAFGRRLIGGADVRREPAQPGNREAREKHDFALKVLSDGSDARTIEASPGDWVKHPVWWLREHARYLAPNGMTDYAAATYYMIRNWLAMLYVFALPVLFISVSTAGVLWPLLVFPEAPSPLSWIANLQWLNIEWLSAGGQKLATPPCGCQATIFGASFFLSPLLPLAAIPLFVAVAAGTAFWITSGGREGWLSNAARNLLHPSSRAMVGAFGVMTAVMAVFALLIADNRMPFFPWPVGEYLSIILMSAAALALGSVAILALFAAWFSTDGFVIETRRRLSRLGATAMITALAIFAFALIDMAAIEIRVNLAHWWINTPILTALPPLIASAGAWLIGLAANSFSDKKGGIFTFVFKHLSLAAMIVGLLLYGVFAVIADTIVQFAVWQPDPSGSIKIGEVASFNAPGVMAAFAILIPLVLLTGTSTNFINLSSLHPLYASRLTRAYLGATNRDRLNIPETNLGDATDRASRRSKAITETDPKDLIDIVRYQQHASGAPLHLINATLNESQSADRSNLTDQDRKGVPITFGPEGVFVDASREDIPRRFLDWGALKDKDVERLTVGQLCAISGAAASSGMGARTTLGTAMTLTFANIRLGYWWKVNNIFDEPPHRPSRISERFRQMAFAGLTKIKTGTYGYLLSEMFGRYKRHNRRVYLTDGGHFENSGAYELLRRKTRVIVVCDNGADPDYQFEDLQNLIRKARIDLNLDIRVAEVADVKRLVGREGAQLFLNAAGGKWRDNVKSRECCGVALLLEVGSFKRSDEERFRDRSPADRASRYMVWIKPSLFPQMSEDLIGYALANPNFPQQTTGDQFFDEAQWESYRTLGAQLMNRLLNETDHGKNLFRALAAAS